MNYTNQNTEVKQQVNHIENIEAITKEAQDIYDEQDVSISSIIDGATDVGSTFNTALEPLGLGGIGYGIGAILGGIGAIITDSSTSHLSTPYNPNGVYAMGTGSGMAKNPSDKGPEKQCSSYGGWSSC